MKDGNNNYLRKIVTIGNVAIILMALIIASSTPLVLACHITTSATATAKYEQIYDWNIEKSVTPDTWSLYPGDQGTSSYTVAVTKSATPRPVYTVSGTVTLTNALDSATKTLTLQIYAQKKSSSGSFGAPTAKLTITPATQLLNGQTGTYNYEFELPAGYVLPGYSYRVVVDVTDTGYSTQILQPFTIPTPVVKNNEIHVDDSNGQSWLFSSSGSQTYPVTFVSPRDAGQHVNTATIRETGASDSATVAVTVPDQPTRTVYFDPVNYPVSESAGTVTLTVKMSTAAAVPVTVSYQTAPGTALADTNYNHVASTLTFDPGQTVKTFAVTILDDGVYSNPDKYFYAEITGVTGPAGIGASDEATVTLTEASSKPIVQFSELTYGASENDLLATLGIELSNPSSQGVTVYYSTHDDSAMSPGDYTGTSTGSVVITAGQLTGAIKVPIINDNVYEGTEYFTVTLDSAQGATVGTDALAEVAIEDNEQVPTVEFKQTGYTVDEDGLKAVLDVTLSGPVGSDVIVEYKTIDGTAFDTVDYTGTDDGTVMFLAGSNTDQHIEVPIIDDLLFAPDNQFTVELTGVSTENAEIGDNNPATVTIVENDPYIVYVHNQWTLVSWPVVNNSIKASDLTDNEALGISIVAIFDPVQQTFKSYTVGDPSDFDFTLSTDMGVFVWGNHDDSFPVYGRLADPHSISLYPDWNLIGWSTLDRVAASNILAHNSNVQIIARYEVSTQSYQSITVGDPSDFDFTLRDGEGYFVYSIGSEPVLLFIGGINDEST